MPELEVTLATCAREPIHIPGLIQPHGLLFACTDDLVIQQVSANVESWLGVAIEAVRGTSFATLLAADSATTLHTALTHVVLREVNPLRLSLSNGAEVDAQLHRSGERIVIELERPSDKTSTGPRGFDPRLRGSILRMQHATTVTELCQVAADEVREVTGFDRVMVYRFDAEWNGEVVAEARRPELEPFLGQHYPASDIPEQARRLYTLNWLRLIADVSYAPVPLVPVLDPLTGAPCDLSHAVLRSVSPIHIEYLRNMGVQASMSVSLLVDGQLAGLIACHHYAGPRILGAPVRDTAEFLGQSLSWQLRVLETAQIAERTRRVQAQEAEIFRSIVNKAELLDGLVCPALLLLTNATGAAAVLDEGTHRIGETPSPAQLAELVTWLRARDEDVFHTERLEAVFPPAARWPTAGLIAVTLSRELGEYLLWFRPSTERTIDWAGDPNKVVVLDHNTGAPRLSPRGSFELWREVVRGRSLPWHAWEIEAASNVRRMLVSGFRKRSVELRKLNAQLLETDRAKDAFIATVSHELRTPLNAISGWTEMLQGGHLDATRIPHALEVIARNAHAQKQIIDDLLDVSRITSGKVTLEIQSVDLPALVESVLEAATLSIAAKDLRLKKLLDTTATPVLGDPVRLRQIISNLVTNAVKFTQKGGSITVVLDRHHSDVEITVRDTGAGIAADFLPHIFEPFSQQDEGMNRRSQGLGIGLSIVHKLVELHGGRVTAESDGVGKGALFRVRLPMAPTTTRAAREEPRDGFSASGLLAKIRILVVEDEPDARELLLIVLGESGAAVRTASSAKEALAILDSNEIDIIVSDIGMPEVDGLQMLRQIRALPAPKRSTPAIALTAYSRAVDRTKALQAGFQAHVPKPVDPHELVTVIASLVGRL